MYTCVFHSQAEQQCRDIAGFAINLSSRNELEDLLFEKFGLKARGKTSGGKRSTSAEVIASWLFCVFVCVCGGGGVQRVCI